MTPIQSAVEAQQRAINLLSGMGGYDGTVAALIGPNALEALLLAQARVWDANEIETAPDGEYFVWWDDSKLEPRRFKKETAVVYKKEWPYGGFQAFGPIPKKAS